MNTIVTEYWPKPIPTARFDWSAWIDGREENGSGHGRTRSGAIMDLLESVDDSWAESTSELVERVAGDRLREIAEAK